MRNLRKLWLIDDDENEHSLVRGALQTGQIPVVLESFHNPADALLKLESLDSDFPDLILCDFDLGRMSGVDFLKRLRASPGTTVIPVVIRSNSRAQEDVDAAYRHGANCFLQKGFNMPAIEKNLKLLLEFWGTMCMPEVRGAGRR